MTEKKIYPDIGKNFHENSAHSYRLSEISMLQKKLEKEQNERETLYKKYKKGINVLDWIDGSCVAIGTALGATGMTLLAGVITAPVAIGLEVGAGIFGLTSIIGTYIRRKLHKKAKKHNDIKTLAKSKLNTISDHISKALRDGDISDEEFRLITDEVRKYEELKTEIYAIAKKTHANTEESVKNALMIAKGREEALTSMIRELAAGKSQ